MDSHSFHGRTRISHHRYFADAVTEIEERGRNATIAITGPPHGGEDSDMELEDDEDLTENVELPNEIAGEVDVFYEESSSESEGEETAPSRNKKQKVTLPKWKKSHIESSGASNGDSMQPPSKILLKNFPYLASVDEFSLYNEIFGEMIDHLVTESTKFANTEKNDPSFSLSKEDFWNFGLILLSGYNTRTSERDYWSKDPFLQCDPFVKTMPRNKFLAIKKYLHAADNQKLDGSKMAKVKPLYNILNKKMQQFGILHYKLSIDESMVPYFGRHSCKQFIRSKPISFGYKLWALCSADGVPYKVDIYEGKTGDSTDGPLGSRVVNTLLQVCDKQNTHHVFMDNFFTSYDLMLDLKQRNFQATGTVRDNRVKKCPITDTKTMKKKERGSYDYQSDGNVEVVKWHDNSVVTLCSNAVGVEPVGKVNRRVKGKGEVKVTQPAVVKEYNLGMGGVDLMDRALSDFRPRIIGKRWYWVLIMNALNISVVFAWRIFELIKGEKVPQKQFRNQLVYAMTKKEKAYPLNRPGASRTVPETVRKDGIGHYPEGITARKCVMCKKSAKIQWGKCDKTLHLMYCFQKFHE